MMARSWLDDPTARPTLLADAPAVEFGPVASPARLAGVLPVAQIPAGEIPPAPTFRQAHLPEYSRRLLAVYAAVAGWPRGMVADLWPWVDWASACFEREDAAGWRGALAEMERWTGVAT